MDKYRKLIWTKYAKCDDNNNNKKHNKPNNDAQIVHSALFDSVCSSPRRASASPVTTTTANGRWRYLFTSRSDAKKEKHVDQVRTARHDDTRLIQLRMTRLGLVDLLVDLLTSKGLSDKIFEESLLLANAMLEDGNTQVQASLQLKLKQQQQQQKTAQFMLLFVGQYI